MVDCTDRLLAACNEVRLGRANEPLVLSDSLYQQTNDDAKVTTTVVSALNCAHYMRKLRAFCRVANDMSDPYEIIRFYFAFMNNVRSVVCVPTNSTSLYAKLTQRKKKWTLTVQFSSDYWKNLTNILFAVPNDYFRTPGETCAIENSYSYAILAHLIELHVSADLFKAWPAYVTFAAIITGDRYARQPFCVVLEEFAPQDDDASASGCKKMKCALNG